MNKSLNIKYALGQIFYYAAMSSMVGFASVYLLSKGFSNANIGLILALSNIIAVVLQPSIAVIADKSSANKINFILRMIILATIVISIFIYISNVSGLILSILFITILAMNISLMPFMNSLAFIFEKYGYKVNFGLARGLGSVAFAVTSMILGNLISLTGESILPLGYVFFNLLLYVAIKVYTVKEVENESSTKEAVANDQLTLVQFISKYKLFMLFLLGGICAFFAHGLINNFFIQIISSVGGGSAEMGNAIFIAAMVELPIMAFFEKINKKFNTAFLMKTSIFFFLVKHVLTYFATNVFMIYIAQFFQMFAYALFFPATVYYVNKVIDEDDRVKGQSFITTAMTIASVFAAISGGVLLDSIGVNASLLIAAIVSLVGFIISLFSIKNNK